MASPVRIIGEAFTSSNKVNPMYDRTTSFMFPAMFMALGPQIVTVRIADMVIIIPEKPLSMTSKARSFYLVNGFKRTL